MQKNTIQALYQLNKFIAAFLFSIFWTSISLAQVINTSGPCQFGTGNASTNPTPFNVDNFSSNGNITIGSGIYDFENFTLNSGHVLLIVGPTPVIIRCTGLATINGTIRANGGNGSNAAPSIYAAGGVSNNGGGQNGGGGSDNNTLGASGGRVELRGKSFISVSGSEGGGWYGPSGCSSSGAGQAGIGGGAGGSYGTQGTGVKMDAQGNPSCGGTIISSNIYGDANLTTVHNNTNLLGGSGGGGGTYFLNAGSPRGGGGGGGGGAFALVANSIQIGANALLTVKGGNGGVGTTNGAAGGGGSGGTILLLYNNITLPNTGSQTLPNSNGTRININTNASLIAPNGIDYSGGSGAFSSGNLSGSGGAGRFLAQVCNATNNQAPTIKTQPNNISACLNDQNLKLSVVAEGTPEPEYQWRKNSINIPGAKSSTYTINTVTLSDAGNYDVVVTNIAGSITSSSVTITVSSPPKADFIFNQTGLYTVSFTNTSMNATNYKWQFQTNNFSNDENPSYQFPYDDTYPVTLISTNLCGNDTITKNVPVKKITSTVDPTLHDQVMVFPNPFHDKFAIKIGNTETSFASAYLMDIQGRIINLKTEAIPFSGTFNIETKNLSPGIYILSLGEGYQQKRLRLVKN